MTNVARGGLTVNACGNELFLCEPLLIELQEKTGLNSLEDIFLSLTEGDIVK